jgi:hypothetical protein
MHAFEKKSGGTTVTKVPESMTVPPVPLFVNAKPTLAPAASSTHRDALQRQ